MQHTKFQGHRPFGSGEEEFQMFLPDMDMAAILVLRPGPFEENFRSPIPWRLHISLILTGQAVSEEKMFKSVGD